MPHDFHALALHLLTEAEGHFALEALREIHGMHSLDWLVSPSRGIQAAKVAAYLHLQNHDLAGSELESLMSRSPRNPWIQYLRGHLLHSRGEHASAVQQLEGLRGTNGLEPWAGIAQADFQPELVDSTEQYRLLASGLALDGLAAPLHARMSDVCVRLLRPQEAFDHARAAAWLRPNRASNWIRLGMAALFSGRSHDAAEAFVTAEQRDRSDARLDALAAEAYCSAGLPGRAYAIARVGILKAPDSLEVATVLTRAAKALGKPSKFPEYQGDMSALEPSPPLLANMERFIYIGIAED